MLSKERNALSCTQKLQSHNDIGKNMKKLITALAACLMITGCGSSVSGQPALTFEEASRLNDAAGVVGSKYQAAQFEAQRNEDFEAYTKAAADQIKDIYATAGFSYEATLVTLHDNLVDVDKEHSAYSGPS